MSLLWLRALPWHNLDHWPGDIHVLWVQQERKRERERETEKQREKEKEKGKKRKKEERKEGRERTRTNHICISFLLPYSSLGKGKLET